MRATDANRAVFEGRRAELERAANEKLAAAQTRAAQLEDQVVSIVVRASEEGKLYGSVGTVEIAGALGRLGLEVSKAEVRMPEGVIRAIGEYEVDVQLHADVTESIRVEVIAE